MLNNIPVDYKTPDRENFAIKFEDAERNLFAAAKDGKMTLYGEKALCEFAAESIADLHLKFTCVSGDSGLLKEFALKYSSRMGGKFEKESENSLKYGGGNIVQSLFAGGCFWCMAMPFYELQGVKKVVSGYAGGELVDPTYEEVKKGDTGHRESVLIEYDKDSVPYEKLLEVYFENIDPFDGGGQFIDRGTNYTCAIFADGKERELAAKYIEKIERREKKRVCVTLLNDGIFYKAEEYHQNYAFKNPEKMQKELELSGRLDKKV